MPEVRRTAVVAIRVEGEPGTQGVGDRALQDLASAETSMRAAADAAREIVERLARMSLEGL